MIVAMGFVGFLFGWLCGRICGADQDDRMEATVAECMRLEAENDRLEAENVRMVEKTKFATRLLEDASGLIERLEAEVAGRRREYASILDLVEEYKADASADAPECCINVSEVS